MRAKENAAPGGKPGTRPETKDHPAESTSSAPPAQVDTVRVWRITRRPYRLGARGHDAGLAAFDRLDGFRQDADYLWLFAPDGRALVIVEGGYYEALRRAAYGHAPVLDPLALDDLYAAEADAWSARARHE